MRRRLLAVMFVLCMVLGMCSTVWAATAGEVLPEAENGWRRIEQSDIEKYVTQNGVWTNGYFTYDPSGSYTFQFKGDKIRILKYFGDWHSKRVHARIDGIDYYSPEFTVTSEKLYLAIEVTGLEDKVHTVEILGTYVDGSHNIIVTPVDIPEDAYIIGEPDRIRLSVLLNVDE